MITVICRLDFIDGPFSFNLTVKLRTLKKRIFLTDHFAMYNNVKEKCIMTAITHRMRIGYLHDDTSGHVM